MRAPPRTDPNAPQLSHGTTCHPTGTGLTAKVVNQDVIGGTIDIGDCDVGANFDEDGVVRNAAFAQPDADPAPSVQHLVRVEGAKVDVRNSTFDVAEDYVDQIIHVGFRDGATGTIVGLRQNRFTTATDADVGIFVFAGSRNTKLIRNRFDSGFGTEIVDNGEATKLPKPFVP